METIKIKPAHKSQGEFVVINAEDFDPKVHKKYEEPKAKVVEAPKPVAE